eukprot:gene33283-40266_t
MESYSEDQRLLDVQDEEHHREKRNKFFSMIKKAQSKTSKTSKRITQFAQTYTDYILKWNDGVIPTLGCWLIWNFVGTMFYGLYDFNSFSKGFYFAINVGYSIGWGALHERTLTSKTFSIFYLLVGAIFVSRWLAHLMTHAIRDSDDAYQNLLVKKRLRAQTQLTGIWADIYIFMVMNHPKLFSIYLWCVYIAFGTSWSVCSLHWTVTEGVYFAISSMSTGGLQHVPPESPDWVFLVTGLFAASGVPIMGMAISNIGHFIFSANRAAELQEAGSVEISAEDCEMLDVLRGGAHGAVEKTPLNKSEFILLSLAHRGLLDFGHLQDLMARFDELDTLHRGVVSFSVQSPGGHVGNTATNPMLSLSQKAGKEEESAVAALEEARAGDRS